MNDMIKASSFYDMMLNKSDNVGNPFLFLEAFCWLKWTQTRPIGDETKDLDTKANEDINTSPGHT